MRQEQCPTQDHPEETPNPTALIVGIQSLMVEGRNPFELGAFTPMPTMAAVNGRDIVHPLVKRTDGSQTVYSDVIPVKGTGQKEVNLLYVNPSRVIINPVFCSSCVLREGSQGQQGFYLTHKKDHHTSSNLLVFIAFLVKVLVLLITFGKTNSGLVREQHTNSIQNACTNSPEY